MKKYTYKTLNTNFNNNTTNSTKGTNFSKMLDDIILSDIKKQNSFLNKKHDNGDFNIFTSLFDNKKKNMSIFDAIDILNKYSKKKNIKFDKGTEYNISGIPVIFYDDEIQIGFNIYSYDDLYDTFFIENLTPKAKEDIIKISIKINI